MKLYGTVSIFSTMRFESVHQYFKRLVRSIRQFRNLPKTLSFRFQRRSALTSDERLRMEVRCVSTTKFDIRELSYDQRKSITDFFEYHAESEESVRLAYHLVYGGYNFYCVKKQSVLALSVDEEDDPIFWKITHVLYLNEQWIVLLQRLECSYEPHFKSYIILQRCPEYVCVKPLSPLHPPMTSFILGGYEGFALKHKIIK